MTLNSIKKNSTDQKNLNQVEISKIIISDEFKLDDGVENFIG